MFEQTGYTDWLSYDNSNHDLLKMNLAFSLYGAPAVCPSKEIEKNCDLEWYGEEKKENVEKLYNKIINCKY